MNDFAIQSVRIWISATSPERPLSDSDQGKARNLVIYAMTGAVEPFMEAMTSELKEALKGAADKP